MNIGIFCSANNDIAEIYFQRTRELGQWMGENGHTLVYGGCNVGLMDCVAQAVKAAGGKVVGIVPTMVEKHGKKSDILNETINTETLSDRKDQFVELSDIIIALPGGIGTLDEIFTVAASHTIGYHSKKVIIYNIDHFYDTLIALLDDLAAKNMMRGKQEDFIVVADSLEEVERLIQS